MRKTLISKYSGSESIIFINGLYEKKFEAFRLTNTINLNIFWQYLEDLIIDLKEIEISNKVFYFSLR